MSNEQDTVDLKGVADNGSDSGDDEQLDNDYIEEQLNATVWGDLRNAVYESRFIAPIIALFGLLLAYHITIAPYRVNVVDDVGHKVVADLVENPPYCADLATISLTTSHCRLQ
jgi:hypothetical protein